MKQSYVDRSLVRDSSKNKGPAQRHPEVKNLNITIALIQHCRVSN